jgi:hypothetical protein
MKPINILFISLFIFVIVISSSLYSSSLNETDNKIINSLKPPDFIKSDVLFNKLPNQKQAEIISQYNHLGFNLKCAGDLRPEEKLGKFNDYICWTSINAAFDDIPATQIAFFFYREKLVQMRLKFPTSSFDKLEKHLDSTLGVNARFGFSITKNSHINQYEPPIIKWKAKNGVVFTSRGEKSDQSVIVLWTSSEILFKSLFDKFFTNLAL